jgi:DNA repair exonuclease SbcCD ATPase subunit
MISIQQMRERAGTIRQTFIDSRREVESNQALLEGYHAMRKTAEEAAAAVTNAAQAAQMRFAGVVAGIVTESLNSVYPDNPYEFKLEFRECAGKTVVDTLLYRDGEPLDPMTGVGGGVRDILAFALRVALLVLTATDHTRKFMGLDEPFVQLHGVVKQRRAYETMESVGKQFGLTILCVRQH